MLTDASRKAIAVKISGWLSPKRTETGKFVHQVLSEQSKGRQAGLEALCDYVQRAHEDARRHLRALAGISLDPAGSPPGTDDPSEGYPSQCHEITLKGYLGENFAAILAQFFAPCGIQDWIVPAHLFRFHLAEFHQIEAIRQTGGVPSPRPGRLGTDCIAFQRAGGEIKKALFCESKCTGTHSATLIAEGHEQLSSALTKPVDLAQLIEVLQESEWPDAKGWIDSLRQYWLNPVGQGYERIDLFTYVCGQRPKQKETWIPSTQPHPKYTSTRRLESVEVHLSSIETIIDTVFRAGATI